jgi:hypothetical protein
VEVHPIDASCEEAQNGLFSVSLIPLKCPSAVATAEMMLTKATKAPKMAKREAIPKEPGEADKSI